MTRATRALAGIGQVSCAMAGTQQPLPAAVKKAVGLPVELHRHVGTAVQVGVGLALESNRKGPGSLARVVDVKRHGLPALDQIVAVTKGQQFVH